MRQADWRLLLACLYLKARGFVVVMSFVVEMMLLLRAVPH